jgi:hypothetical protein
VPFRGSDAISSLYQTKIGGCQYFLRTGVILFMCKRRFSIGRGRYCMFAGVGVCFDTADVTEVETCAGLTEMFAIRGSKQTCYVVTRFKTSNN